MCPLISLLLTSCISVVHLMCIVRPTVLMNMSWYVSAITVQNSSALLKIPCVPPIHPSFPPNPWHLYFPPLAVASQTVLNRAGEWTSCFICDHRVEAFTIKHEVVCDFDTYPEQVEEFLSGSSFLFSVEGRLQ